VPGLTGCGCLLLVSILVGGIVFMIFGSTDPGEPVEQIAALAVLLVLTRMALVPVRRTLVRVRGA
jgi:hypothetical protein